MPWRRDAPGHGFTRGEPWLPFGDDHGELAVDAQQADPDSLLTFTRKIIALRKRLPALRWGTMEILEAGPQKLVFERAFAGQRLRCTFNLSANEAPLSPHNGALVSVGDVLANALGPFAALIEEI